jgi:hypothetical protein
MFSGKRLASALLAITLIAPSVASLAGAHAGADASRQQSADRRRIAVGPFDSAGEARLAAMNTGGRLVGEPYKLDLLGVVQWWQDVIIEYQ